MSSEPMLFSKTIVTTEAELRSKIRDVVAECDTNDGFALSGDRWLRHGNGPWDGNDLLVDELTDALMDVFVNG